MEAYQVNGHPTADQHNGEPGDLNTQGHERWISTTGDREMDTDGDRHSHREYRMEKDIDGDMDCDSHYSDHQDRKETDHARDGHESHCNRDCDWLDASLEKVPKRRLKKVSAFMLHNQPSNPNSLPSKHSSPEIRSTADVGVPLDSCALNMEDAFNPSVADASIPQELSQPTDDLGSPLHPASELKTTVGVLLGCTDSDSESLKVGDDADLDPLFAAPDLFEGWDASKEPLWDSGEEEEERKQSSKEIRLVRKKNKRSSTLGGEEEIKGKGKRRSRNSAGENGGPKVSVREMRRLKKQSRADLENIHAESQRLLRETRNASFKPVPPVEKPISSVLEKIRKRKIEMLRSFGGSCQPDSSMDADCTVVQIAHKLSIPESPGVRREHHANSETEVNVQSSRSFPDLPTGVLANEGVCDNPRMSVKDDIKNFDNASKDCEILSSPGTNSNHDVSDESSSEEYSDKENKDPRHDEMMKDSAHKSNIAKDFIDDEAEEEDNSDHDMLRFQDNEEDDESDEDEVANDIIATGYEESPIDHERRTELHQKWLEQQDAAATENFRQKLDYGVVSKEENNEVADNMSEDEALYGRLSSDSDKKPLKKVKLMFAQMFTDEKDTYIPSDDEEAEDLLCQRLLRQNEEEPSFASPIEDDNSKEVFGLIKKLNISPNVQKGKVSTSSFNMLVSCGGSNSSTKSSFLGRARNNSLPSAHKQGSTTLRTFVFGRDDSSSRNGMSANNLSNNGQKVNQPAEAASAKLNTSQSNATGLKAKAETKTSSSFLEILWQSSVHMDKHNKTRTDQVYAITESQAALQFSAFKLGRKFSRQEARR